ncbi:MAG: adenylate/guanylate cyclase domain-containing protein [Acidimicrobiales bacterium]
MSDLDDRQAAVRRLLDGSADARERADWSSAIAMAEAAAALDPQSPEVAATLARAREGASAGTTGSGTRRRVSVMFCDLQGSTEIASSRDPEETREVLHAYHQACTVIVSQYAGHVAHLMGDGLLVYFGYPRAHEDDGLRAVLAALAIVDAMSRLRSESTGEEWNLKVRIGIHTGLAVISDMGSGTWARPGDIVGETPNLAARVQAEAPPGMVLISADTLRLVHRRVDVAPLGARTLRGINRPVELFRVLSVHSEDDELKDDEVIGRNIERAALERAWTVAKQSGGYVVVAGEAGIGKSHFVRYAQRMVRADGGRHVTLRCSPLHSNTPLYPVVQQLSRMGSDFDDCGKQLEWLAGITEFAGIANDESLYLLANLASVPWPDDRRVPELQPEQARERTFGVLLAWLDALRADGPTLLVIEDLHWADPSTLELLHRCVADKRGPLLVLATTRQASGAAPGEPSVVIELGSIDADTCDELIDTLTSGRLDEATRRLVAERGDGVPLYIRELARMVVGDEGTDLPSDSITVPPTLNDLLVARLDSFPDQREVVEVLAVLGRPATTELINHLLPRSEAEVQNHLDLLERGGILRQAGAPPHYEFHHALLRDAAYEVQLLARRRELHRRAAAVLHELFSIAPDDQPQVLAHHYELAGDLESAAIYWMRSGLRHASIAAHAEAIGSFEQALRLAPHVKQNADEFEMGAQSGLAASLLAARGYTAPEVAAAYSRVRELSAVRGGHPHVLSLYGLWAYYHVTGESAASLETAERLLEQAVASNDADAQLAANAVLGYQLLRFGRLTESIDPLRIGRTWRSSQPLFPHHAGIGAGANLAMALWLLGHFAEARASVQEAVEAAEALEGPAAHFTRAYTHAFASELFQVAGQPGIARQHAGRAVQIAAEFGFASWLGAGMTNMKIAEALEGEPESAIPAIEYCLTAWRSAGASSSATQFGLGLALAYRTAGRPTNALAALEAALQVAEQSNERFIEAELYRVTGELITELDPANPAGLAALEQALAIAVEQGTRALRLRALMAIEHRHRTCDDCRSTIADLRALLSELDPTASDPEPLLAQARAL